jgi:hypothetical protein
MKKRKLFGFIETDPKILFHYLPLVGVVIAGYYISTSLGLMELVKTNAVLGWSALVLLYYITLLIGDNLIHTYIIHKD